MAANPWQLSCLSLEFVLSFEMIGGAPVSTDGSHGHGLQAELPNSINWTKQLTDNNNVADFALAA